MGLRAFEGFLGLGGFWQDNVRQSAWGRPPGVTGGALLN